ncbi:MAG: LuxR family transcriptional regulator [Sulfuricaulis sp.]|nr:LuxR family transcriptional regulator [Sulfuricaulis sp.]
MDLSKFRHAALALDTLGARERAVMERLATGATQKSIGIELGISASTVATHRRRVLEKLELANNAEIAVFIHEQQRAGIAELQRAGIL